MGQLCRPARPTGRPAHTHTRLVSGWRARPNSWRPKQAVCKLAPLQSKRCPTGWLCQASGPNGVELLSCSVAPEVLLAGAYQAVCSLACGLAHSTKRAQLVPVFSCLSLLAANTWPLVCCPVGWLQMNRLRQTTLESRFQRCSIPKLQLKFQFRPLWTSWPVLRCAS